MGIFKLNPSWAVNKIEVMFVHSKESMAAGFASSHQRLSGMQRTKCLAEIGNVKFAHMLTTLALRLISLKFGGRSESSIEDSGFSK
jgi:hypothetical protein